MNKLRTLAKEALFYVECFVIPAIAVVLPWWLTFKLFRLIAHLPYLYNPVVRPSLEGAKYLGVVNGSEEQWCRAAKVTAMVDYADVFLLAFRRSTYLKKYCKENIRETLTQQQIIFTPHYGAGGWLYRLLIDEQLKVAVLINRPPKSWRAQDLIGHLRLSVLEKMGVLIMPPEDILALRQILREKRTLVVMPDIPNTYDTDCYQPQTALGKLNVASGFFDLAEKRDIPVIMTILGVNPKTGYREFTGVSALYQSAKQNARSFAELTAKAISKHSHQWRMLIVAPQVIQRNEA